MERTYTIPLRKAFLKTPLYVRTNRAVREVQMFLKRHMKTEDVRLGEELNKSLWARGNSNPPSRVTVLVRMEEQTAYAELVGKDFKKKNFTEQEEPTKRGLDEAALKAAADVKPKKAEKTEEAAEEAKPAAKKAAAKKAVKK